MWQCVSKLSFCVFLKQCQNIIYFQRRIGVEPMLPKQRRDETRLELNEAQVVDVPMEDISRNVDPVEEMETDPTEIADEGIIDLSDDETREEIEFLQTDLQLQFEQTRRSFCKFFGDLEDQFTIDFVNHAKAKFNMIIQDRFVHNVPFSTVQSIHLNSLNWDQMNPEISPTMTDLVDRVKNFANSDALQQVYIRSFGTLIEPRDLIIEGRYVGQRVCLLELSNFFLRNCSIVQRILKEKAEIGIPIKYEMLDSELTCSVERRKRLLGKLRFNIGCDDFTVARKHGSKHKYFACYLEFANIPAKQRLKRESIFLLAIISRQLMKEDDSVSKLTINQVMKPIFDDLKHMETIGVDINFKTPNDELKTENIKGVISAFCCDNLGQNELFCLKLSWNTGFICRKCAAPFKEIQNERSELRRLLGDSEDVAKYNNIVDDIEAARAIEDESTRKKQLKKAMENELGVQDRCIFTQLDGVSIWNVTPPDALHDIAEGVVERLLTTFILKSAINLEKHEIAGRISNFLFYNGKISVAYGKDRSFKIKNCKAVQVSIF